VLEHHELLMWELEEEEDFAVMLVEQFLLVDFDKLETFFFKKIWKSNVKIN
jgi:hypothetical protein